MSPGGAWVTALAVAPATEGVVRAVSGAAGLVLQGAGTTPLPAEPPIGGVVWTVVVPAVLLVGSFVATYLLYRHFAREE